MMSLRSIFLTSAVWLFFNGLVLLQAQQSSPDVHTFTAKNGKTLTARVLGVSGGKVSISRMSDGKNFQLPANSLSAADVTFLKTWLKHRELMGHPAGWKILRVHLPEFVDSVEAPGIPAAFRRVGLHTWEAELPEKAWVLIRLWRRSGDWYAPEFLLPYDGQSEWTFTYQKSKLYRSVAAGKSRPVLVGIDIEDDGGKEQLKALKDEIPDSGVCIFAGFLDDADFALLGSKPVFSFVVRKTPRLSVAGSKIRAIRVIRDLVSFDGLSSLKELEYLDITMTGDFPLGDVSRLKSLTTLVADGDVSLGPATGESAWPALRRLSLQRADIEDADKFGDFIAGLPELESLALPDENEMNVKGVAACPKLSVLRLGDECYDPQVAGLKELKQLRTVFLSGTYNGSEVVALADGGLFAKVTTLKTHVEMPFSKLPLLSNLYLTGDQDDLDMAILAGIAGLTNLEVQMMSSDDVQALQSSAANLKKLSMLSVRFPRCPDIAALAKLPALKYLKVYEQFGTSEQDLTALNVTAFATLQGLDLQQMQSLQSVKVAGGGSVLSAVSIRKCGELKSLVAAELAQNMGELCIANCDQLADLEGLLNPDSLKVLHLANSPQLKKAAGGNLPDKWQRLFIKKAGAFK
ncbi:MAG: hypothetical protein QM496_14620 [Verrucomicrobiota bacterium]